jgi:ABC-type Fe3+-hydroxamate transport system substrate-binding protein
MLLPALNLFREVRGFNMKTILASLVVLTALSGCISSSSPPAPQKSTTVVVPADSGTTVICSDGTHPPCN